MISKLHRLNRQEFIQVKKNGKSYSFPNFSVTIYKQLQPKYSIVTSAKFNKSAVVRNRFRRQVYPILKSLPPNYWLIFYPKPSMLKLSGDQISSLLTPALSPLLIP
jgi:ribonuclease P protein component